ncbi:helix-turn-helix domain-containing protein [Salinivibrio kushneri]|uniref:helix-turn-helix domain-containing protein n=1 Tax=Salinivibrio kushneri TaxID=1908198 RepID=UPI000988B43D|nr:helix-turn-helix transcriptional regulator [Salinivibrio kushneri]OOE71698.1 hypothetical protein BZG19_01950 [Salinivibrio kushneri]
MKEKPLHPFVIYIKRLLNERGISYADLSEMAGVSLGTIKHVMCGNQCMTLSVRDSLCHALNVTPLDAFLYELPDRLDPANPASLAKLIADLNKEQRYALAGLILTMASSNTNQ